MRFGRQAHFLAHGEIGVELERRGLRRVARLDPQGKDNAAVVAERLAAVGLFDTLRRGKLGFDARDIVGSGKVQRRRQAGVAGIAPIGDRAGRKSNLEPGEIAAARDEARLRLRGERPIGRERIGGERGRAGKDEAKARQRARLQSAGLLRPREAS